MIDAIDYVLNRVTMYRLVLYYLIALLIIALPLSYIHVLSFTPFALIVSTSVFVLSCWIANTVLAELFHAQKNFESVYISALILALIVTPVTSIHALVNLCFISVFAMASKYILTIKRKHIFNPVAFGVWFVGLALAQNASWWVGTAWMLPFVFIGGLLIVRKIKHEDLVFSFFVTSLVTILGLSILTGRTDVITALRKTVLETPLFFFAFVMLTEPLTTPPTKKLQIYYGVLTGIFFAPQFHIFSYYFSPEEALLIGNIFSYLVSPKDKLFLHLKEKIQVAPDIFDFVFSKPSTFSYMPGQYMEWTLAHPNPDSRGERRYLTLASAPTEDTVRIGVRFNSPSSSYKKTLMNFSDQQEIIATQLAGDFTLPNNGNEKLVFLAGGIGVTPFRSMIKYLLDTKQKRDIILFYTAKTPDELPYMDVFDQAAKELGIKVIYSITDTSKQYPRWKGRVGRLTEDVLRKEIPDYMDRTFYFSGPQAMIKAFEKILKGMGVPNSRMKEDFFPGFA